MAAKIQNHLAKRIKELRRKQSLTQEQLADMSGVDYKHIQRMEGKTPNDAKIGTLEKIAKAFKMPLSELLEFRK